MGKWITGLLLVLLLLRFPALAAFVSGILVLTLGLAAFSTLCSALFGGPSRACREQLCRRPLRCYLMGILALSLEVLLVQQWAPLALPLLLANVLWLSFGIPALAVMAGEGLGVNGRWAPAAGSLSMGLSLAFPPGWLLLSQLTLAALGSALLPARWRR